jgi:hypothetical protein
MNKYRQNDSGVNTKEGSKMKRKSFFILAVAVIFCLAVSGAQAATVTMLPAIQNVAPGDPFSLDLEFNFNDPVDGVLGGGIDISFDDTVLDYVSYSWNPAFEAQIDPSLKQNPTDNSDGTLGLLSGWNFGNFNGLTGTGIIGTVNFARNLTPLPGGLTEINMAESASSGGWYAADTAGTQITPTLNGATVVPIPGSILLLGSGVLGLVGLSRRKRS